ncbi:NapC/NirT family cytochrome c [Thiocystis minor]|uniref:NapC/NirT family cytochrome c n=1 Tax=Thiocystis minor TaxID=61597 RepID=UPI0030B8EFA0
MQDHRQTSAPKNRARRATWLILLAGIGIGILFWGGFNTAMEATNTEPFCISCHEMKVNVYKESSPWTIRNRSREVPRHTRTRRTPD